MSRSPPPRSTRRRPPRLEPRGPEHPGAPPPECPGGRPPAPVAAACVSRRGAGVSPQGPLFPPPEIRVPTGSTGSVRGPPPEPPARRVEVLAPPEKSSSVSLTVLQDRRPPDRARNPLESLTRPLSQALARGVLWTQAGRAGRGQAGRGRTGGFRGRTGEVGVGWAGSGRTGFRKGFEQSGGSESGQQHYGGSGQRMCVGEDLLGADPPRFFCGVPRTGPKPDIPRSPSHSRFMRVQSSGRRLLGKTQTQLLSTGKS